MYSCNVVVSNPKKGWLVKTFEFVALCILSTLLILSEVSSNSKMPLFGLIAFMAITLNQYGELRKDTGRKIDEGKKLIACSVVVLSIGLQAFFLVWWLSITSFLFGAFMLYEGKRAVKNQTLFIPAKSFRAWEK